MRKWIKQMIRSIRNGGYARVRGLEVDRSVWEVRKC